MDHDLRLRSESDTLAINKLHTDNARAREDLHDKDSYIDRLRKELEQLRNDAEFKSLQISKLSSEVSSKGDLNANLRVDAGELAKDLDQENANNKHLKLELDRFNDELRNLNNHHGKQLDQVKSLEAQVRSSRSQVDSLNITVHDRDHELRCMESDLIQQDKEILALRTTLSQLNGDVDHMTKCVNQATSDHASVSRLLDTDKLRTLDVQKVVDSSD